VLPCGTMTPASVATQRIHSAFWNTASRYVPSTSDRTCLISQKCTEHAGSLRQHQWHECYFIPDPRSSGELLGPGGSQNGIHTRPSGSFAMSSRFLQYPQPVWLEALTFEPSPKCNPGRATPPLRAEESAIPAHRAMDHCQTMQARKRLQKNAQARCQYAALRS
jgi:hypothetical protein